MKSLFTIVLVSFYSLVLNSNTDVIKSIAYKNVTNISNIVSSGKKFIYKTNSQKSLEEQYFSWAKSLPKTDIIKIIIYQEKTMLGFSTADAQNLAKKLENKSLTDVFDIFTMYQKQLLFNKKKSISRDEQRSEELHNIYSQEQANLPLLRKVPIVHNLETKVLPDITTITDQGLYTKIEEEMKKMGFSQAQINNEIAIFKKSSVEELEKKVSGLQEELVKRLYYVNKANFQVSQGVMSLDQYMHTFHTWISTAASIASSGGIFLGFNSAFLSSVANFKLFNPSLTQAAGYSKQEILSMIYAQYKSCNDFKSDYIHSNFQETTLLSKAEILSKIQDDLKKIVLDQEVINTQINKYKNLSKEELEVIFTELDDASNYMKSLKMSENEKKILTLTKSDLLKEVEKYLPKNKDQKEKNIELLNQLKNENIYLVRTYLLDLMQSFDKKEERAPNILSAKETILHKSPKVVSDVLANHALDYIRHDWQTSQKSKIYQYWRERGLRQNLEQKRAGDIERHVMQTYESANLIRPIMP